MSTTFTCHTAGESPHIVENAPSPPAFLEYLLLPPFPPNTYLSIPIPLSQFLVFSPGLWAPLGSCQRFSPSIQMLFFIITKVEGKTPRFSLKTHLLGFLHLVYIIIFIITILIKETFSKSPSLMGPMMLVYQ